MILAECSQPAVNILFTDIYQSILYVDTWIYYYLAAITIHFIIDFYPSGSTFFSAGRLVRKICICKKLMKCCRRKKKDVAALDNYDRMENS